MKISRPTILAVAACCAAAAVLSYLLVDGRSEPSEEAIAEPFFVPPPIDDGPALGHAVSSDSPAKSVRPSGDILDAEGNQRWRRPVDLAPIGQVVIPHGALRTEPRRRVGAQLRDGVPVAEAEPAFFFPAPTEEGPARVSAIPWTRGGAEGPRTTLAPMDPSQAATRARSNGSPAGPPDGEAFSNQIDDGLAGATTTGLHGEVPAGRTAQPAGSEPSPAAGVDDVAGEVTPPRRVWSKGNFTREEQLLRTQIGWQAFAQIVNEQALQKIRQEQQARGER